jgi:adenosylmethionine-8-amino-7-oxononanoate aminotransferase
VRLVAAARAQGLLLSSTGCADGANGDLLLFGPPLCVTDAEVDELVTITADTIATNLPS